MAGNQSISTEMGKSSPTQNNTTVTNNEPPDVAESIMEFSIQNQRQKVKTKVK